MKIDKNHPRAKSLMIREKLVEGLEKNLASKAGLIAHGRGEAFDYLIGEKTHQFARRATRAASALLLTSKRVILSINGNVASISLKNYVKLAKLLGCKIEVNLFHSKKERIAAIENAVKKIDPKVLLSSSKHKKITIPEIASKRRIVLGEGIGNADVVFVPLEDGDRCQALEKMGKKVITIDLNPLSRTARTASVTIVDNIIRALPNLINEIKLQKKKKYNHLRRIYKDFNNKKTLSEAITCINKGLSILSGKK